MIASETRNHCAAVVMDLSTRASSGGGGGSDDGNGRRRSGSGRPAKSVFSIRSLVGEDPTVQHDENVDTDQNQNNNDHRRNHYTQRHNPEENDCNDEDNGKLVEFFFVTNMIS